MSGVLWYFFKRNKKNYSHNKINNVFLFVLGIAILSQMSIIILINAIIEIYKFEIAVMYPQPHITLCFLSKLQFLYTS